MPVRTRPPLSLLPESPMRTSTDFSSEPPRLVFRAYRGPVTLKATINLFRRELTSCYATGQRESESVKEFVSIQSLGKIGEGGIVLLAGIYILVTGLTSKFL